MSSLGFTVNRMWSERQETTIIYPSSEGSVYDLSFGVTGVSFEHFSSPESSSVEVSHVVRGEAFVFKCDTLPLVSGITQGSFSFAFIASIWDSERIPVPPIYALVSLGGSLCSWFFMLVVPDALYEVLVCKDFSSKVPSESGGDTICPVPFISAS